MTHLQSIRGTKDLLGEESRLYQYIVNSATQLAFLYNYQYLQIPTIEFTELYKRSVGETSDIVSKEIYSFTDKSGEEIGLRPEFTAGVARAIISNGWYNKLPLKLFSYGSLFRYERPQKGRQREFSQLNFEHIGVDNFMFDAELVSMISHFLKCLNIPFELNINSIGNNFSRQNYKKVLVEYLQDYSTKLSEDSQRRLVTNPLRILDSKDKGDIDILAKIPSIYDYHDNESAEYWAAIQESLKNLNIPFILNPRLVRGLDYYSHLVFEFINDEIGSQSTICGGGKYNSLFEQIGGKTTSAIGCALGIERLILLLLNKTIPEMQNQLCDFIILPFSSSEQNFALKLCQDIREKLRSAEILIFPNALRKRMNKSDKIGKNMIIIGEDEINQNKISVKSLDTGNEDSYGINEFLEQL